MYSSLETIRTPHFAYPDSGFYALCLSLGTERNLQSCETMFAKFPSLSPLSTIHSKMFGFGSTSSSAPSTLPEPTRIPPLSPPVESPPVRRTFERLVEEELPIQRHSVAMEGGMPSCLTLFDNFLLCYCTFSPSLSSSPQNPN